MPHAAIGELRLRGHDVRLLEASLDQPIESDLADVQAVIVHELTQPEIVSALGRLRANGGRFLLLLHDGGVRSALEPDALRTLDLEGYDAVLVGSEAVAEIYRGWGFGRRVRVWREAIDVWRFRPSRENGTGEGIISLTDWTDAARGEDLVRMLLRPARDAGLPLKLFGHGYPEDVAAKLADASVELAEAPEEEGIAAVLADALVAVELSSRTLNERLPGMVTPSMLRVLASGVPLLVANWRDEEGLFTIGEDLLVARDADEMTWQLRRLRDDEGLRAMLGAQGRLTVLAHHSASHRAEELIQLMAELREEPAATAHASDRRAREKLASTTEPIDESPR